MLRQELKQSCVCGGGGGLCKYILQYKKFYPRKEKEILKEKIYFLILLLTPAS